MSQRGRKRLLMRSAGQEGQRSGDWIRGGHLQIGHTTLVMLPPSGRFTLKPETIAHVRFKLLKDGNHELQVDPLPPKGEAK